MCTIVRASRPTTTWLVEHERLAACRPPQTTYLAAAQPTTGNTERRRPLGTRCFQLLPRRDQLLDEFLRRQPDVDAEPLHPLLLLQAPKPQLRALHAQTGPLLNACYPGGIHVEDSRLMWLCELTSSSSFTARTTFSPGRGNGLRRGRDRRKATQPSPTTRLSG